MEVALRTPPGCQVVNSSLTQMTAELPEPTAAHEGPAILFVAAKSLQGYVLGSDKLREMVGATQLIEDFCSRSFSESFLEAVGVHAYQIVTAAAGQTTIRFDSVREARFAAALWPLAADSHAPGLEVHVAVAPLEQADGSYAKAFDMIQKHLAEARNVVQLLDLPAAPPLAMRAPRSGKMAVDYEVFCNQTEAIDAEAAAKRERRMRIRRDQRTDRGEQSMFEAFGFDPDKVGPDLNSLAQLPLSLRNFTADDGNPRKHAARQPTLAIIHADGNGLGQAFIDLARGLRSAPNQDAMKCTEAFSEGLRRVGLEATRKTMERLRVDFLDPLPVLPVVLAGDDLTLVARSEIAIPFAQAWLEAFEQESENALRELKALFPAVGHNVAAEFFSAGAGILFFSRSHPILDAYHRCEELASFAKREAKLRASVGEFAPSALAFLRLSGADDVTSQAPNGTYALSGMPYYLGRLANRHRSLSQLRELRSALASLPSGSCRRLLAELRRHPDAAQALLDRSLRVLASKTPRGTEVRARIERALEALHDEPRVWAPLATDAGQEQFWSAIPDAVQWLAVEPELDQNIAPVEAV